MKNKIPKNMHGFLIELHFFWNAVCYKSINIREGYTFKILKNQNLFYCGLRQCIYYAALLQPFFVCFVTKYLGVTSMIYKGF